MPSSPSVGCKQTLNSETGTMSVHHIIRPLFSLLLAGTFIACDTGITEPMDVVFPESNISYSHHVQPLFDVSCSFSGCHNSTDRAGNLSLASYFDLINRAGMIIPGDSARSLLVQVTSGRQPHTTNLSYIISSAHARGVAVWVEEGALNN